jgi:hypothetical protein
MKGDYHAMSACAKSRGAESGLPGEELQEDVDGERTNAEKSHDQDDEVGGFHAVRITA